MRPWLKVSLAVSLLTLAVSVVGYALTHPALLHVRYDLRLATGPMGSDGQKLLAAFIRDLATERPLVRMIPVQTPDSATSGKALTTGQVDLAVLRSDDEAAAQGRTIFILRRIGIAILVPPGSHIEDIGSLVGKKLALAKGAHVDSKLLRVLTEFYGIREADIIDMALPQIGPALKDHRIAAVIVFGPLGSGEIADAFAALRKAHKGKPKFLDFPEADAIAARWPAYESVEIKQGTFGGSPAEPEEDINTFAVSVRLISRTSLPDRVAGELTRLLLATKARLVTTLPAVGQMEAPDTEKGSVLRVHPGTLAYLNGDQVSLLDETLNYYWLVGMVFAGLTSCVGWLAAKAGFRRRDELLESQARLAELLREVKSASPGELAGLDEELGQMMDRFFMKLALGEIEAGQFQGIERVVSQLRATIEKRSTDHAAAQLPAERARTPALQA